MKKIALIGSYFPRKCGIATFTYDLYNSIKQENDCMVIAMNDGEKYDYPPEVKLEIKQQSLEDYVTTAKFLNRSGVEVVCIQHEFGIFGGKNGNYILELIKRLKMPAVTTLHTILDTPDSDQKHVLRKLAIYSSRVIVMSRMGKRMLHDIYGIDSEKIKIIGHGIPDPNQFIYKNYKEELGIEGKKVLMTFGLLSKSKGIETTLRALPQIVQQHKDTVYIVLGASHPHVVKHEGENYREYLLNLTRELGLTSHVIFIDKFVSQEELFGFLQMSDIYIIPYLSEKQITSGTLAYAMATDNAIVSTPFWHAQEALSERKGVFFDFHDSNALARIITKLLDNKPLLQRYQEKAAEYARQFDWKVVGEKYLALFNAAVQRKLIRFFKIQENEQISGV